MKRFLKLLIPLYLLTLTGCRSIPVDTQVILETMPQHTDFEPVASVADMANVIVKQDAIIKEWEAWGQNVRELLEDDGTSNSR